jgi:hypothetical protein
MLIELARELEAGVKAQALTLGLSVDEYLSDMVRRDLPKTQDASHAAFKTGRGACAGSVPSAQEIDDCRAEIFACFGERE